jgi:hypothetical protein
MPNSLSLTIANQPGFPEGSVVGGYIVTLIGAASGAQAALPLVTPAAAASPIDVGTLAPDTWTASIVTVGADGATKIPGTTTATTNSLTIAVPTTVSLNIATGGTLS